jgi:hypothetical protein
MHGETTREVPNPHPGEGRGPVGKRWYRTAKPSQLDPGRRRGTLAVRGLGDASPLRPRVSERAYPNVATTAPNIVLAIPLYTTVPWSALTLPGYILDASCLFGGIVAIVGALSDRRDQAA